MSFKISLSTNLNKKLKDFDSHKTI